ncbi:MAG: acylphosphatase [Candidatus Moduliflexus flocculans]|nr:acylphosphatase [Candidatus Moduliflexus flocculans]
MHSTGDRPRIKEFRSTIQGIVQGVGFRPFVYRLATGARLSGWVRNTPAGVFLEAQGPEEQLSAFLNDLREKTLTPGGDHLPRVQRDPGGGRGCFYHPEERWRGKQYPDCPRRRCLSRLPSGTLRPDRSSLPLSLHQLHQLRTAVYHHQ